MSSLQQSLFLSMSSIIYGGGGKLYAWGSGANGRLGDSTATSKSSPVRIGALTTWSAVAGGGSHSLGIAGGKLYAWGNGSNGQLGDSTATSKSSPVHIGALTTLSAVACGVYHSLGIL